MTFKSESFQIDETSSARMLPQSLRDSSLPEGANTNEVFPATCLPPSFRENVPVSVPPSGREGDRVAVEGERRYLSSLRAFR